MAQGGPLGRALAIIKQVGLFMHPCQGACLPIVDVPVHIVTGMPMTVGMGMRVAFTMGTKRTHNRHCPWLQSQARPLYFGCAHDSFYGHNSYKWVDGWIRSYSES